MFCREERDKYYYHRGKAKDPARSNNYLCMILDGMDQNKLLVPSLMTESKAYGSAWRLKTHLTGIMALNLKSVNSRLLKFSIQTEITTTYLNIFLSELKRIYLLFHRRI